jgi:uncharacterized protein
MAKLVLLVVLVIVVVAWLRGLRRVQPPREPEGGVPPAQAPGAPRVESEAMVSCAQCGVHLPRSEAVTGRLGVYCGEAHRLVHERSAPPA